MMHYMKASALVCMNFMQRRMHLVDVKNAQMKISGLADWPLPEQCAHHDTDVTVCGVRLECVYTGIPARLVQQVFREVQPREHIHSWGFG